MELRAAKTYLNDPALLHRRARGASATTLVSGDYSSPSHIVSMKKEVIK